jgi:hypothetical protein
VLSALPTVCLLLCALLYASARISASQQQDNGKQSNTGSSSSSISSNSKDLQSIPRKGVEISPSVMIYGFPDMESDKGPSPCQAAISNSKGLNAKKINFMITVYGVHKNNAFERCEANWGRALHGSTCSSGGPKQLCT